MNETTTERSIDLFAEGLWQRLRDILIAQSRWDAFIHDPDKGANGETPPKESASSMALQMILRALRVAVDPVNMAILRRLAGEDEVGLMEIEKQTGLSRTAAIETLHDLSQVGLASYAVDSRTARVTAGAIGLLGLLEDVCTRLTAIVEERWNTRS